MKVNKIYRAMMRNQVRAAIAVAIIGSLIIGCTAIKQQVTSAHYTAWDIYCAEYQVDNEWYTTTEALEPSCRVAKNIAISIIY